MLFFYVYLIIYDITTDGAMGFGGGWLGWLSLGTCMHHINALGGAAACAN